MKLNNNMVNKLRGLNDQELWKEIQNMASSYGIKLPDKTPNATELSKVREALNIGEINTMEAMRMLNDFKRRQG